MRPEDRARSAVRQPRLRSGALAALRLLEMCPLLPVDVFVHLVGLNSCSSAYQQLARLQRAGLADVERVDLGYLMGERRIGLWNITDMEARETVPVSAAPVAPVPDKVAVIAPPVVNIDPNALPMPASGEAQYKLRMGIVSGELILSWKFTDGHYRLDSIAQGTGIFAIAGKYVQASEGDIAAGGLRPTTFSVERRGKKDSAAFNWTDNSVRFYGKSGERTEAATPGTQDMLSLLFQLAFAPPLGDDLTVIVTNGRKLERYAFERAGEEVISLEGGKFHTLKILKQRKGDEDGMEVWLALEHHYLPVKIRVTDKKGSVIEQSLMAMKVVSAK